MRVRMLWFLMFGLWVAAPDAWAGFEEGLAASREGDRVTAFSAYREAARQGDARAFGMLGSMYLYGLGTERDYRLAYVWFSLAAEAGDITGERYRRSAASVLSYEEVGEAERLLEVYRGRLAPDSGEQPERP